MTEPHQAIDLLIRQGNSHAAATLILVELRKKKITRAEKLVLARLARRAAIPKAGILLLRPYVRPLGRDAWHPTPEEQTEFAACLIGVGATWEALQILSNSNLEQVPEAHL